MKHSFIYHEIDDYFKQKAEEGKHLGRDEAFAVFGYCKAMYTAKSISLDEYDEFIKRLPIPEDEFEAITI